MLLQAATAVMVGVAQLAERQVVVLDVVGSSPIVHPKFRAGQRPDGYRWFLDLWRRSRHFPASPGKCRQCRPGRAVTVTTSHSPSRFQRAFTPLRTCRSGRVSRHVSSLGNLQQLHKLGI